MGNRQNNGSLKSLLRLDYEAGFNTQGVEVGFRNTD